MNTRAIMIFIRAESVLRDIPGAYLFESERSATPHAALVMAKDFSAVKEPLAKVLYHGRLDEYDEAEHLLDALEAWIEKRKQADWQNVFPFPRVETQKF